MSRIYWDTMLFIYLLEDHQVYAPRVRQLLERSYKRRDSLFTSYLALGEVLAGAEKSPHPEKAMAILQTLQEMGFSYLPFDEGAAGAFSRLRAREKLRVAGSIHLARPASAGIDLFLTGDQQLVKLDIPGKWGSCLSTVATICCVLRMFGRLLKADTSLAVLRRHSPASDRRAFLDGATFYG